MRNIVVNDMRNALHVEPARRHIGGHQNIEMTFPEPVHRRLALLLGDIAVERRGCITARFELVGQLFRRRFGAHKHNHAIKRFGFQNAGQCIHLVASADHPVTLANRFRRLLLHLDGHLFGMIQMLLGNFANHRRHGGREQRDLTLIRRLLQNPLHIIDKTHAQHLIGLIEHQRLQIAQIERFAPHMIHHPARRTDHDMHAAFELAQLHIVTLAAVNRQHMKAFEVTGIGFECFRHLNRQLTRRRQHHQLRRFLV